MLREDFVKKIKDVLKRNWIWMAGFLVVFLCIYSNIFFRNYQLSATNIMYDRVPWNSMGIETAGLSAPDHADSLLPSLYGLFHSSKPVSFGFWNSYIGLGSTEDLSFLLYPLSYLFLFPLKYAVLIKSILKYVIGFGGMYWFLRSYGMKKAAAVIGGTLYTFASPMVLWHFWPHTDVTMLAPLMFLMLKKMLETLKIRYFTAFAAMGYLLLVAGMPTFAAYFIYVAGIYTLVYSIQLYRKDWKKLFFSWLFFGAAVLLFFLLSSPYTIDLVSSVGSNGYLGRRDSLGKAALPLRYLWTWLCPTVQNGINNTIESTFFMGFTPLILLPFTFWNKEKKQHVIFWAAVLAVTGILAYTNFGSGLYNRLPAIGTSYKPRVLITGCFALAFLSASSVNDMIENREYYSAKKVKLALCGIFLVLLMIFLGCMVPAGYGKKIAVSVVIVVGGFILLLGFLFSGTKMILNIAVCVTVLIGAAFARKNLSWVDGEAPAVPEATDSIAYLQEHTDMERVLPLGEWAYMPNTNVYYGLNFVTSHNFVNTNEDVRNYMMAIQENMEELATRLEFTGIDNMNLVKYLGVRYLAGSADGSRILQVAGDKQPIGEIYNLSTVEQTFTADKNGLSGISFQTATYNRPPVEGACWDIVILDMETGETAAHCTLDHKDIPDNGYVTVYFEPVMNCKGKLFKIVVTANVGAGGGYTLYACPSEKTYQGALWINGIKSDRNLDIAMIYSLEGYEEADPVYYGEDRMVVLEMKEYSERLELAEKLIVKETEEDVLTEMSSAYQENTGFITEECSQELGIGEYDKKLDEQEYAYFLSYTDDEATAEVNAKEERLLLFNDYYDENWKVYVDGEEKELVRANYLMRGVMIDCAGTHTVTFKYVPARSIWLFVVSGGAAVACLLLLLFQKRLDRLFARMIKKEERTFVQP